MVIYENVVIGNFLFGLGAVYGLRHQSGLMPPMCVNLLQQTPMDSRLGDVLLQSSAFVRILEFKRSSNKSKKEVRKLKFLRASIGGSHLMASTSRRIHWYIESEDNGQCEVVPYLDFDRDDIPRFSMTSLISETVGAIANRTQEDMGACETYLQLLMKCNAVGGVAGGASAGALIVGLTENGLIQYAAVRELADLQHTRRELIQREIKIERQHLHEQSMSYSQDRGMSM